MDDTYKHSDAQVSEDLEYQSVAKFWKEYTFACDRVSLYRDEGVLCVTGCHGRIEGRDAW